MRVAAGYFCVCDWLIQIRVRWHSTRETVVWRADFDVFD